MRKKDVTDTILELLRQSRFGLNLKTITEKLECSRTTVTKYLNQLEQEGLIIDRQIGQYKVWIHRDAFFAGNEMKLPANSFLFSLFASMLRNMEEVGIKSKDVKELGKKIAKDFNFSEYLDNQYLQPTETLPDLAEIADRLMRVIDSICKIYDAYEWQPPIVRPKKWEIILRLHGSALITLAPYHFYLISGFFEHEMNKYVGGHVDVIQIQEKEKIVDFQFELDVGAKIH